jgi:RNA polymerase sigma-70 factor (ECF subfamily)
MDTRAQIFRSHRPRLFALAYRMLSSKSDAEDVLQDAYLRWHGVDVDTVESSEAWLTIVVTRLAIDYLRKAKVAREAYSGPWLPEPLADSDIRTPEAIAEFDGDLSIAFLTVLETLGARGACCLYPARHHGRRLRRYCRSARQEPGGVPANGASGT